jgi:hypothetical protein
MMALILTRQRVDAQSRQTFIRKLGVQLSVAFLRNLRNLRMSRIVPIPLVDSSVDYADSGDYAER